MGNSSSSRVEGKWTIKLKFNFGKVVTLKDFLHVPDIRKNLVSGPLLNQKGFKLVFESNKFVLTKGGMYVGKGYLADGLFKLNVMVANTMTKNNISAYIADSFDLWHARLGHVNSRSLHRMMNLGLIPKLDFDVKSKCEVCVESKFARHTYKTVQGRTSELLDLIHIDICDFKSLSTRGGKNYFIIFINA